MEEGNKNNSEVNMGVMEFVNSHIRKVISWNLSTLACSLLPAMTCQCLLDLHRFRDRSAYTEEHFIFSLLNYFLDISFWNVLLTPAIKHPYTSIIVSIVTTMAHDPD